MAVKKDALDRKNEILDVAQRLFISNGYEATSTNDILSEVKIARGTLYYHFSSKEEILDAMIDRVIYKMTAKAKATAGDKSIPIVSRMVGVVMSFNAEDDVGIMINEEIHRPQNALLHQKLQNRLLSEINPMMVDLVNEGIEQGIMKNRFPKEAVDMIFTYSYVAFDDDQKLSQEEKIQKALGFIYNMERILGMEENSITAEVMKIFEK